MSRVVFHGGQVFDATGVSPDPPRSADVVVEDGRIVEVGPGLDGDDGVDCSGKTLIPGLFDCHTHVMVSHFDLWEMVHTPFSLQFFEAKVNLEATLAAGITTVRDAGGADLGVKTAVERGFVNGPRMQISITMLSQTGGHGDKWMVCGGGLPTPFGLSHPGKPSGLVDGPEEMRKKVRELIRAGADVIKVATSGGVLSPRDDPRHGHFRHDELAVLVGETNAAGIFVMAHSQATEGIKSSIRAGIRSIEHGIYLDDEAIELMLEWGTFLVPTLMAPMGVVELAAAGAMVSASSLRKAEMVMATPRRLDPRPRSTPGEGGHGHRLRRHPPRQQPPRLALMVEHGMTPAGALVAASRTAADLMGVSDELGTIEPGKRADLVVVDGDPLEVDSSRPDRVGLEGRPARRLQGVGAILDALSTAMRCSVRRVRGSGRRVVQRRPQPGGGLDELLDHVEHDLGGRLHLVHLPDDLADEVVHELLGAGAFGVRRPLAMRPWASAMSIPCSGIGQRVGVVRVVPLVGPRRAQLAGRLAGGARGCARCPTTSPRRNFSFTTGWVSASSVVSHTDPHHTPWAPSAIAAAIWRPVAMPPAASTGVGATASTTSGTSTIVAISPVWPPAS